MLAQAALRACARSGAGYRWYVLHVSQLAASNKGTVYTFSLEVDGAWTPTTMTGWTAPAPYEALASSYYDSRYLPWMAFDGNPSSAWHFTGAPNWLAIDMGAAVVATAWRLLSNGNSPLVDFTIRGSNTSPTAGLVTLATVTGWSASPTEITGSL